MQYKWKGPWHAAWHDRVFLYVHSMYLFLNEFFHIFWKRRAEGFF